MMAAGGGYVMLTPAGIVKTITALPKTMQVVTGNKPPSAELQLEVELKKMFPVPFFPARKVYISSSELQLPSLLVPPTERRLSGAELARMRQQDEIERKKMVEYERSHIMTAPFRHMSVAFYNAFRAMKRTWVREGFMKIGVGEKMYKLDVSDGWALDGGRALDRLAKRKPVM
jgi:hypothetical protein